MPAGKAFDDALGVVQRGTQSSAAAAVNKLAVRLAAGTDRLAELVRRDQDLGAEAEAPDKAIIAAVSRERSKRDAAAEQRSRERLAVISTERAGLQKTFAAEFPDYAALSNPLPMTAKDGPHYANNVKMDGPGQYRVTYQFTPPVANGFLRHTDQETGVPEWWKPFSVNFVFSYPQK